MGSVERSRRWVGLPPSRALTGTALFIVLFAVAALGWPLPGARQGVPVERHVIALAPLAA